MADKRKGKQLVRNGQGMRFDQKLSEALTLDDLGEVYSASYPARAKWYNIGLAVTSITRSVLMFEHPLRVSDLDSIKSQSSDPGICLREMLSVYLKSGGASWFDIIEALGQNIVGENQLADRLLEKVPEYEGNGDPGDSFHKDGDTLYRNILRGNIHTVIGRQGSGKSALVNNLVEEEVAEESDDVSMVTPPMRVYETSFGGNKVSLYDAPGFGQVSYTLDDDEILDDIETGISDGGMVVTYCVQMDQNDMGSEVESICKATKRFGTTMWEKGVFALTFANKVGIADFQRKLTQCQRMLRNILIKDAKVPARIANKVPVIPAGYKDCMLHSCDDWVARLKDAVMERACGGQAEGCRDRVGVWWPGSRMP